MPRAKNPLWINWRSCKARAILLEDLEPGGLLDGMGQLSEADVWEFYRTLPEFNKVVFSQFQARLKDHRTQSGVLREMAERDAEAVQHDREFYPRRAMNSRGQLKFDMQPAKYVLRGDVKNGLHQVMTPSELKSMRPEYGGFSYEKFKQRIYQEVRRQKFLYYLSLKRAKQKPAPARNRAMFLARSFAEHYASTTQQH
jgi:hypothetical protein